MLQSRLVAGMFPIGLMVLGASMVFGQTYPNRPIRIVASEAGGGGDFAARLIAQGLTDGLGQPVIVENRPSNIVGEIAAKVQPDGYSLLVEGVSFWIAPLLRKMPYDVTRDFSPVTLASAAPYCLVVHPSVPAKSVKELIDLAKAKPGEINYASAGIGGGAHLAGELFKAMTGVNIAHIPYKGSGPAAIGLIGGQVQMMIANPPAVTPHIKSGKLRALAVTSAQPTALFPGLPTVSASGLPGYEVTVTTALFAPIKTPVAIISRLNQETVRILHRSDVKERFFNTGVEAVGTSPGELGSSIKSDLAKWGKIIKDAGMRAD